jgi:hypothetical protein
MLGYIYLVLWFFGILWQGAWIFIKNKSASSPCVDWIFYVDL